VKQLTDADSDCAGVSLSCADAIMRVCEMREIVSPDGAVDLGVTREKIDEILCSELDGEEVKEYVTHEAAVLNTILHSRYVNLYKLLRHHLSEESYLGLVRNQILVDVQVSIVIRIAMISSRLRRSLNLFFICSIHNSGRRLVVSNLYVQHFAAKRWRRISLSRVYSARLL